MTILNIKPLITDFSNFENEMAQINKAYEICKSILKNAYQENGINAGETHFSDVWLRDSCFASIGALCLQDTDVVKKALTKIIEHMKDDGQCPLRIGEIYFLLKYFKLKGPQGPTYIEDKYVSIPMDSNALFIIVTAQYIKQSNNAVFLDSHYKSLKKALLWYETHLKDNLVFEGPFAGWADSLKKRGHVLYTNTLYCYAIKCVAEMAESNKNETDHKIFRDKFKQTKEQFNKLFWNGRYLNDWAYKTNMNTRLSVDGNALAIIFDLISKDKQQSICDKIIKKNMITAFGIKSVNQPYSWKDSYTPFLFVGLRDYHNGLNWLWLSAIASIAFGKTTNHRPAITIMAAISELILKHGTVYEVYTKDADPVNRLFYKSEKGFAWSAGCFIWCYSALFGNKFK